MSDLTLRPITGRAELDLFRTLTYVLDDELADDLDAGRRHPEWMWLALRDGRPVARLSWWSRPGAEAPALLDVFDLADGTSPEVGARLFTTAAAAVLTGPTPPEYIRYVPGDWHDDPAARQAVGARIAALELTGARPLVERLRLEWRPGTPISPPTGRLAFRPVAGRDELVTMMAEVLDGTLDAHGRADLTRMTPAEAAGNQYDDEFAGYSTPREWWTVATLPDGEPVGFVIPAHNGYNPIVAYIGVRPAHRGRGHIDEILAEGTRILAAQEVPRIRASTDVGNRPMAAAFARAGWVNFERAINLTWDRPPATGTPA